VKKFDFLQKDRQYIFRNGVLKPSKFT